MRIEWINDDSLSVRIRTEEQPDLQRRLSALGIALIWYIGLEESEGRVYGNLSLANRTILALEDSNIYNGSACMDLSVPSQDMSPDEESTQSI